MSVIIYDRMNDSAMQERFRNLSAGHSSGVFINRIRNHPAWKPQKAVAYTDEHEEAYGSYVMTTKAGNSKVINFELAPKYGRLWHTSHFDSLDETLRFSRLSPMHALYCIRYADPPEGVTEEWFQKNICNLLTLYNGDADSQMQGIFEIAWPFRQSRCIRLRSPQEAAAVLGIEPDHRLIADFYSSFPGFTEADIARPWEYIFYGMHSEWSLSLTSNSRYHGANPAMYDFTLRIENGQRRTTGTNDAYSIPCITMDIQSIIWPLGASLKKLRYMVVPFAFLDYSPSDMCVYEMDGWVRVIIPESLPAKYHYPPIWNLFAGISCVLPYTNTDWEDVGRTRSVFTHDGNTVPIEFFEIVEEVVE